MALDLKEYYNDHIKGKKGYCGTIEEDQFFIFGAWGYHCEIEELDGSYMTSYLYTSIFDFLLYGTWKIENFTIDDQYKEIKLAELYLEVERHQSDLDYTKQQIEKLKNT